MAISTSGGISSRHGRRSRGSRRFEQMAITTGSVPMIIVGSAPPARWIAAARQR